MFYSNVAPILVALGIYLHSYFDRSSLTAQKNYGN